MEKKITCSSNAKGNDNMEMEALLVRLSKWAKEPVVILRDFYAECLEEEISISQTCHLIEAQAAFLLTIIPADISLVARLLLFGWLVSATLRCKKAMTKQ